MQYLVIPLVLAISLMSIIMLVFINVWSEVAVKYEVQHTLVREVRRNLKMVSLENHELVFMDSYEREADDIYFLILDKNGVVIDGVYPEGFEEGCPIEFNKTRQIRRNGQTYYVRDMQRTKALGVEYFMRGVVESSKLHSHYETLRYFSYVSILMVVIVVFSCEVVLIKKISSSLREMCVSAESIGREYKFFDRIKGESIFYELEVLKQAENRMLDKFEQTLAEQEQFTSDAAHELRTPIAVIIAQCEHSKARGGSIEKLEQSQEVIYRQAKKINGIITQLLNLSRLGQKEYKIGQEEIELAEIVSVLCEDEQEKSHDKVQIVQHLKETYVCGDINLLMIAIQNLLSNAIKFSHKGGIIEVGIDTKGQDVYVWVKDYGIGIAQKDMQSVFQRFYKEEESRNSEGIGLGLPLAMKIAERHGGTIKVESQLGEGSTFCIILPKITKK